MYMEKKSIQLTVECLLCTSAFLLSGVTVVKLKASFLGAYVLAGCFVYYQLDAVSSVTEHMGLDEVSPAHKCHNTFLSYLGAGQSLKEIAIL